MERRTELEFKKMMSTEEVSKEKKSRRITYNVLRIDVGGLTKLPVSIPTNVYLKIQMFISEGK